jgi:ATP-dependent Clp protease adaptor protein ClpS
MTGSRMQYPVYMAGRDDRGGQTGDAVRERVKPRTKEPTLYSVVLLNDDYTPMGFVVDVLEALFQKSPAEAHRIMMQVHVSGRGVAGVYPWEIAETKVDLLLTTAREAGHPLQATIEHA